MLLGFLQGAKHELVWVDVVQVHCISYTSTYVVAQCGKVRFINPEDVDGVCLWKAYVQKVVFRNNWKGINKDTTSHRKQGSTAKWDADIIVSIVNIKVC